MENNIYITTNYALCPFLVKHGLKYLKSEHNSETNKVTFYFEDRENIGRDVSMEFRFSDEKKYKDMLHFFRNEIEEAKTGDSNDTKK